MSANGNWDDRHQPARQPAGNGPSTMAWMTVLLGVGSWFIIPLIGAVIALFCGLAERRKIAEGTSSPEGKSLVTIGLVAAAIQLALAALAIVVVILFFAMIMLGVAVA